MVTYFCEHSKISRSKKMGLRILL